MNDLITVIINVYNREDLIRRCLDSVVNQTYSNLEILIVNDGSTDGTLKICESFNDNRIKIITTKNQGLSLSRNVGLDNANGKYIYFVDSDDFIDLDTIEYLYKLCFIHNADIATCDRLTIFDYNYVNENKIESIYILDNYDMLKKVLLSENNADAAWNKLIKKEIFNNIRFENRIINDVAVMHKVILNSTKTVYSNQKKYYFLKHNNAITTKGYENYDRAIDYFKVITERYEYIDRIFPNMMENKIGFLRSLLLLHLIENPEVEKYLYKHCSFDLFKKMFSVKLILSKIKSKEKIKLLLFRISPKLYKKIGLKYRRKYKYKM